MSLTPIGADWYVNALETLSLNETDEYSVIIDLKLALLTHYRVIGKEEEYAILVEKLTENKSHFKPEQVRRFYYDCCLMASSKMEYEKLRKYLSEWIVFDTDFIGALWKSAMLMEADLTRIMVSSEPTNQLKMW